MESVDKANMRSRAMNELADRCSVGLARLTQASERLGYLKNAIVQCACFSPSGDAAPTKIMLDAARLRFLLADVAHKAVEFDVMLDRAESHCVQISADLQMHALLDMCPE